MFGYVIPAKEPLSEAQRERYYQVYCGVCKGLGQEHGQFARLFLSYDFTFLAMLLGSAGIGETETCRIRCPAKLGKKVCACETTAPFVLVADMCMILSHWQLRDKISDDGFFSAVSARMLLLSLKKAYRKAAARLPDFDRAVAQCLGELHALERQQERSLDRVADCFARILQHAAAVITDENRRRVVGQMLYHVGRWIYLVDAWDDMPGDKKSGSYNPMYLRFGAQAEEQWDYVRTTLLHSRNMAAAAYQLSDFGADGPLIENILSDGMETVERLVSERKWKARRLAHERPV